MAQFRMKSLDHAVSASCGPYLQGSGALIGSTEATHADPPYLHSICKAISPLAFWWSRFQSTRTTWRTETVADERLAAESASRYMMLGP